MKITLNSNNDIHRKIGLMYRGCKIVEKPKSGICEIRKLVGVAENDFKFILQGWTKAGYYGADNSITIDLDTAELDLRLAIGEDMEFESGGRSVGSITHYFTQVNYEDSLCLSNFSGDLGVADIQLSREWLESQGVEVSE
jgi:hypothetical protein